MLLHVTYEELENRTTRLQQRLAELLHDSLDREDREMFQRVMAGLDDFAAWTERRALLVEIKSKETALSDLRVKLAALNDIVELT